MFPSDSTVLFWLGDESEDAIDTWNFLERRIQNVMAIEKTKAKIKNTPLGRSMVDFFDLIKKPSNDHKSSFPGYKS